jgi:hypothetical protein
MFIQELESSGGVSYMSLLIKLSIGTIVFYSHAYHLISSRRQTMVPDLGSAAGM